MPRRGVGEVFRRLCLMVNDACVSFRGEPDELLAERWEHAVDVDLDGVIHSATRPAR